MLIFDKYIVLINIESFFCIVRVFLQILRNSLFVNIVIVSNSIYRLGLKIFKSVYKIILVEVVLVIS